MQSYNTTDLVADIRRRGSIPDSAYTAAEILREADQAMLLEVVPTVVAVKQDYWTTTVTIPLVDGQTTYRLPERAIASTQRDVYLTDSEGRTFDLPELSPIRGRNFRNASFYSLGGTSGYYLRGETLVLATDFNVSAGEASIVVAYERRPGSLVATTAAAKITAVTGAHFVCANVPAWTTATKLDLVQSRPGLDVLVASTTATTVTTATGGGLTFSATISSASVGDFWCEATRSCVVQAPDICYPVLVASTLCRLMESEGDMQAAALARDNAERAKAAATATMSPRGRGNGRKVVNRFSPLRGRWRRGSY